MSRPLNVYLLIAQICLLNQSHKAYLLEINKNYIHEFSGVGEEGDEVGVVLIFVFSILNLIRKMCYVQNVIVLFGENY